MFALEILHGNRQFFIVDIAMFRVRRGPLKRVEAAPQPPDFIAPHAHRQQPGVRGLGLPNDGEFPEPVSRQLIEGHAFIVLAQIQGGEPIVQRGQHHAVPLSVIVGQRQDGRPVQGSDLRPGTALLQAR